MRNENKFWIIIFVLGIIFAVSPYNSFMINNDQGENEGAIENRDGSNLETPRISGYWSTKFIHIDGNWSYTVGNYSWCSGDGSWGNPYIIENVSIDASGSPTGSGIFIYNSINDYFIIKNCTVFNAGSIFDNAGIQLENTNNGILMNNNFSNNGKYGILLIYCDNNTISRNTVNDNSQVGISLVNSDYNIISRNTVNDNNQGGIHLVYSSFNNITGNTANNNDYGIFLISNCDNNFLSRNYIYFNTERAIYISSAVLSYDIIITRNSLVSVDAKFIYDGGINTSIGINYYLPTAPSLCIDVLDQSFSTTEFIIAINISSGLGFELFLQSIDIWWNGIAVPSNNISELENGVYNITLTPIFVVPGQDSICLCIIITSANHWNKHFEMNITVEPPEIIKYLQVEFTDHSYSLEYFNFTFFVFNETGQGVDSATIQMWWNGTDVSADVENLGNGLYLVSIDPITVAPGEDSILFNMTISASYHGDTYFETYLAVEPPEVVKLLQIDITKSSYSTEIFNLTFYIFDEINQSVDSAIIQMWWNGTDVSTDILNLGSGFYFVSLEPITVAPREDPILLNMVISAGGYEDKSLETYIAVDPDTLSGKGYNPPVTPPVPILGIVLITFGSVGSIAGLILYLSKRIRSSK